MWINPKTLEQSDEQLDGYEYVNPVTPPDTERLTKANLVGAGLIDGIWQQKWSIEPLSDVEAAQVKAGEIANLQADIGSRIQVMLDASAKAHGYDSIVNAIGYAEEPAVPKFQAEGKAFRAWRSLVWAYCYSELAKAVAGARQVPTIYEFVLELPALKLPA